MNKYLSIIDTTARQYVFNIENENFYVKTSNDIYTVSDLETCSSVFLKIFDKKEPFTLSHDENLSVFNPVNLVGVKYWKE